MLASAAEPINLGRTRYNRKILFIVDSDKKRLHQKIALTIASSGIAVNLLDSGRTAHLTFNLPLDIHNKPNAIMYHRKEWWNSGSVGKEFGVWNECTMHTNIHSKRCIVLCIRFKKQ